nr:retrovirus-related Pol polyprotein from transposon TNT 1-94 [Tanacetum cinerariifolium]
MEVKTAFLHGTFKEDVYVCQPEGFINADHPSHVYKLKKALYGLKQAPRTWYDELSTFLLQNHFFKGTIDPTPDIVHATCLCARYHAKTTKKHLKEVKKIFRYLCGTQFLGEKLKSWSSKKQDYTALSTAKAEYVSLSACCAQVIWMQTQLTDYGFYFNKILIYCDSKLAIAISCNPVQYSRTKHIAVRYHFIKEHVEKDTIELYFVKTDYQLADLFTKALLVDRFNYLVRRLGMRSLSPQGLERLAKSRMRMLVKKCSSQEVSKAISRLKDQDIKFKNKDIKSKIKIQDHKHAKGTPEEFQSLQGSKTQDVTRSEAICAMTTP